MKPRTRSTNTITPLNCVRALLVVVMPLAISLATDPVSAATGAETSTLASGETETATFAGGCFWCVESDFDTVAGVLRTTSGYTSGKLQNPTYRQVSAGGTGHREAVEIEYDPKRIAYSELLDIFWRSVDPTDAGGQFCDRGESYATAIFTHSPQQHSQALASKLSIDQAGILPKPIATTVESASAFYPAEGYHQDYYTKSPIRYRFYRFSCGRDARVEELWGDQAMRGIGKH